jgi:NAD(P)-dependent dehydrogenase (short-subunit alcohol dehydrogenase family)
MPGSRCFFCEIWLHGSDNSLDVAIIGSVEELSASLRTQTLVRDQFETNYFGPVNIIKATLPHMRKQRSGHIMVLGGISMIFPCICKF